MSQDNLPIKNRDDFFADAETMDLSKIKNETFLVAISTGDRDQGKFISQSTHGPYNFYEMIEEVSALWVTEQVHAKVVICDKNRLSKIKTLDANTIDYIEAHASDLLMDALLEGAFDDNKEFTCQAGIIEDDGSSDIRHAKKDTSNEEENV